jgi:hypothetical protein
MHPSPGAVGPASRLWRRYAGAPAAALLTGLGAGEWALLRSAHTPIICFDDKDAADFLNGRSSAQQNQRLIWLKCLMWHRSYKFSFYFHVFAV